MWQRKTKTRDNTVVRDTQISRGQPSVPLGPLELQDYDYYLLKLNVTLSEDDSCLYKRFGSFIFNVMPCDASIACVPCGSGTPEPINDPETRVMPDASIVAVDIDRCDCTKAVFTMVVRLHSVKQCLTDGNATPTGTWSSATGASSGKRNDFKTEYGDMKSSCASAIAPLTPAVVTAYTILEATESSCARLVDKINTLLVELGLFLVANASNNAVVLAVTTFIDETLKPLKTFYDVCNIPCAPPGTTHLEQTFCLVSGSTGYERLLVSFLVKPLAPSVVSTGVINECYSYEITRIVPRECPSDSKVEYEVPCSPPLSGLPCIVSPAPAVLSYVPSKLQITVPFTEQIKCLVPDFGLPGNLFNSNLGSIGTTVKVVAQCPRPFTFPAVLYFDRKNCTSCLVIDIEVLKNIRDGMISLSSIPYSHAFGSFGCVSTGASDSASLNEFLLSLNDNLQAFEFLSRVRKFDVLGVHKCTTNVLFSFQICIVPQPEYCIDVCGRKIKTQIRTSGSPDFIPLYPNLPSFKVQMAGDHTYCFDYAPPPPPTSTPPV